MAEFQQNNSVNFQGEEFNCEPLADD